MNKLHAYALLNHIRDHVPYMDELDQIIRGRRLISMDLIAQASLAIYPVPELTYWAIGLLPPRLYRYDWVDLIAAICNIENLHERITSCINLNELNYYSYGRAVSKMVQEIRNEEDYNRLPDLAAVLESFGCHNHIILDHCRRSEPHYLGCFVLERIV
jgi:hypothetical protein